jgi:hypothetical protein
VKQPLVVIAAADTPTTSPTWGAVHKAAGIGISISEPLPTSGAYYPEPLKPGLDGTVEWYADPTNPNNGFLDHPLETSSGSANTNDSAAALAARPLVQERLQSTGTTVDYKTVVLQRLANPSMPFDPIMNPYRTVDWLPVDLTVFNGADSYNNHTAAPTPDWDSTFGGTTGRANDGNYWDTDDVYGDPHAANYFKGGSSLVKFMARQRAGSAPGSPDFPNVWTQSSVTPTQLPLVTAGTPPNFPFDLYNTLGYLNTTYWASPTPIAPLSSTNWLSPPAATTAPQPPNSLISSGNVRVVGNPEARGSPYVGDPMQPIPWITWNNRPYISQLELLQVPACSAARMVWEFQIASASSNPYTPPGLGAPAYANVPYPQLAGLFQSEASTTTGTAPQLYRILEYVGVPSRFVGTETFANPLDPSMTFGNSGYNSHSFHPPFNRISHYREPGRINLNTIYSSDVLRGLLNYFPGLNDATTWNKFVQSRRGLSATDPLAPDSTGTYPTLFAHPFRSFAGGDMVPTLNGQPALQLNREIEATVLRSDPTNGNRPLFQFDTTLALTTTGPNANVGPCNDPNRNAFFRYQAIERLGNLVTTRSNVYAMWITVGYFQVTPAPIKAGGTSYDPTIYPDGYQLGPELGADTGEVERHRAFYIYDRTIPVGFQRGQDINVEKGLLLRRFIE